MKLVQYNLMSLIGIGLVLFVSACSKAPAQAVSVDVSQWIAENRLDEAAEHIKNALIQKPRDPNLLYNQSVIKRLQGQLVEARGEASKALSYAPNDSSIKLLMVELALEFSETDDALELFQTLPAEIRSQPRALVINGVIYSQQRKWQEAAVLFQNAIDQGDRSLAALAALANAYAQQGKADQAKLALQQAEALQPANPDDIRQIAECYLALSDAQKARELAMPIASIRDNDARIWSLIGRCEMILLRFSESESAFTRALASPNTTPWHLVEYAMMLFAAQREEEALAKAAAAESQLMSQGVQIHNPTLYNLLATLYARDHQWLLANRYLTQSIQIDNNQPKVRELLAKVKHHFNASSPAVNHATTE